MSILRPACYDKFKTLIGTSFPTSSSPHSLPLTHPSDGIYTAFESSSDVEKVSPPLPELETLLHQIIADVVGPTKGALLTKDVDLFTFGVDSLQCARVRNSVMKRVEMKGGVLGQNVVYEYPSVMQCVFSFV